jgi:hypothetical protein
VPNTHKFNLLNYLVERRWIFVPKTVPRLILYYRTFLIDRHQPYTSNFQEEAKEPPKNCHICDKIVYPVERVIAAKNVYHNVCFKCCKCSKKLTPTTFNSHEGQLFCRGGYFLRNFGEILRAVFWGDFGKIFGEHF